MGNPHTFKSKGHFPKRSLVFKIQNDWTMIQLDNFEVSKGVGRVHVNPLYTGKGPIKFFHDKVSLLSIIHPGEPLSCGYKITQLKLCNYLSKKISTRNMTLSEENFLIP